MLDSFGCAVLRSFQDFGSLCTLLRDDRRMRRRWIAQTARRGRRVLVCGLARDPRCRFWAAARITSVALEQTAVAKPDRNGPGRGRGAPNSKSRGAKTEDHPARTDPAMMARRCGLRARCLCVYLRPCSSYHTSRLKCARQLKRASFIILHKHKRLALVSVRAMLH